MKKLISLIIILISVLSFAACSGKTETESQTETSAQTETVETVEASLWNDAVYQEDAELGEGEKIIYIEVKAEGKTVKFTVHTDAETVGDALTENNLVQGEEGPYGLYIKKVNGITADYDVDQSYWNFLIDSETAMTGVDQTNITEGATYQLEYTK